MGLKTMKVIKVMGKDRPQVCEVPIPSLRDDYLLVKVNSIALNPADWKLGTYDSTIGCTVGADYAGTVVEVGPKVTTPWKPGDRICGFTHGGNINEMEDGCFAEYAVVKGDAGQMRPPGNMTDEEASTLGVGIVTVGQALYQCLGFPLPGEGRVDATLLVHGGSSATGALMIQYAVLSGCRVIATCGPRNFDYVKSLGAEATFDYNDPECGKKIREHTGDNLEYATDCAAVGDSAKICCQAISSKGGTIWYILHVVEHERSDVKATFSLGYTFTGEPFTFVNGQDWPASPEDFDFARKFCALSTALLAQGKIRPHRSQTGKGGLAGALEGIQKLRDGKVSGMKLVYNVADKP